MMDVLLLTDEFMMLGGGALKQAVGAGTFTGGGVLGVRSSFCSEVTDESFILKKSPVTAVLRSPKTRSRADVLELNRARTGPEPGQNRATCMK